MPTGSAPVGLELRPQERIEAVGTAADGVTIVATTQRLWIGGAEGAVVGGDWSDIAHAHWRSGVLQIDWNHDGSVSELALEGRPRRLISTVHRRLTASIVASDLVQGSSGLIEVAIRRSAQGELFCQVYASIGPDLDNPDTAAKVTAAAERLREAAGLD